MSNTTPYKSYIKPTTGLVVDGSYLHSQKICQYQIMDIETGELIYRSPEYIGGSSNVAEYLAIIHAAAYCHKHGIRGVIYSDSSIARSWVQRKCYRGEMWMSDQLTEVVTRAIDWVKRGKVNNKVYKWRTYEWGENPADFGRK